MNDASLTLAWYVAPVVATAAFSGSAMPTMFAATAYLFGFPYFAAYFHVWPGVFPSYCKAVWRSQYHFEWKTTAVDARLRLSKVLAEELLKEAGTTKETQTDADMPFISAATSPLSEFASFPPGTIPPAQQDVLWSAQSKPLLLSGTSTKPQPVAKSRHALAQLYREIMTTAASPERSPNDIARGVVNLYNLLADEQTAGSETFLDDFLARMSSAHGARRAGKLLRSTIGSAPFFGRSGAYRLLSEWMNGDMHVDFQLAHDVELDLSDIEDLLYEKGIVMVWISHVVWMIMLHPSSQ